MGPVHAEAREQLTAAVAVLREDPDTDTVRALGELGEAGGVRRLTRRRQADRRGAGPGPGPGRRRGQLAGLFITRGIYHSFAGRRPQSGRLLPGGRPAGRAGRRHRLLGRALLNLSDTLAGTDPAAGAEAARAAAGHCAGAGDRDQLAIAIGNLAQALLMLGDWDAAESRAGPGRGGRRPGRHRDTWPATGPGWRRCAATPRTAEAMLAGLGDLRASEDLQDRAMLSVAEGLTAAARRQRADTLRHARAALAHADALGISYEDLRWAWPLAARAAYDLGDTAATGDLLALLDGYQPGRAGSHAARRTRPGPRPPRRAATATGPPARRSRPPSAGLREHSTPYHLAHGLLDHAGYLHPPGRARRRRGRHQRGPRASPARLRCQPLLDRAAGSLPAAAQIRA